MSFTTKDTDDFLSVQREIINSLKKEYDEKILKLKKLTLDNDSRKIYNIYLELINIFKKYEISLKQIEQSNNHIKDKKKYKKNTLYYNLKSLMEQNIKKNVIIISSIDIEYNIKKDKLNIILQELYKKKKILYQYKKINPKLIQVYLYLIKHIQRIMF